MAGGERSFVRRVLGLRHKCVARGWRIAIQSGWRGRFFQGSAVQRVEPAVTIIAAGGGVLLTVS